MDRIATTGWLLTTLLVAPAGVPAAAEEAPLSMAQAIDAALANSHWLHAADAGQRAAAAAIDEAAAARLPRVEISEEIYRTTNPVLVFSGKLGQQQFGLGDFDPDRLNDPDAFDNFQTRLVVSQPLYTGGRIKHTLGAARRYGDAAVAARERARQEVVHQVVEAYVRVVVAGYQLDVAQQSRETVRSHLNLVRDLFESGLVVESDVLQVQVRESEIEEMAIRAESAVAVSKAALNLAMGRDQTEPVEVDRAVDVETEVPGSGLDTLVEEALGARPDLRAEAARVGAAGQEAAAARAGRYPALLVGGSYELNGEDLTSFDGDNWTVQLGLRFTLFEGGATAARVRQAEARRDAAEQQRALLAETMALEVRQAYHEVDASAQRLEQARRAVTLAERSLTIVEDRYREGLTTLVDLQEAESGLTAARSRVVTSASDLLLARTALDLAVGRL